MVYGSGIAAVLSGTGKIFEQIPANSEGLALPGIAGCCLTAVRSKNSADLKNRQKRQVDRIVVQHFSRDQTLLGPCIFCPIVAIEARSTSVPQRVFQLHFLSDKSR